MFWKKKRIINKDLIKTYHDMACLICAQKPSDSAHIKTVKSGGDDIRENIMPLCRQHHQLQHQIGIITFIESFPEVERYVTELGWKIQEGKLRHDFVK